MHRNDLDEAAKLLIFTVRVNNKTYRCPVAQEALCLLCKPDTAVRDQIDAYLVVKAKIQKAVEHLLNGGVAQLPPVLQPEHFND